MAESKEQERHNINLSRRVWGELKLRSVQESASASELIAYVVEKYNPEDPSLAGMSRYQPRGSNEDRLGRTVFFPPATWKKAQALAAQNGISVAGLIDYLLKKYLGIADEIEYAIPERPEFVRVGEERVYLGENPVKIDLKTGKPLQE